MSIAPAAYDIFLAYASADRAKATKLFDLLTRRGLHVFMDIKGITLGDFWDDVLSSAQARSSTTVLLISPNTDTAFYQREEIATAISMARKGDHRVIPVYLSKTHREDKVPYGLRRIHGVFATTENGLVLAADDIAAACRPLGKIAPRFQSGPASDPNVESAMDSSELRPGISAMRLGFDPIFHSAKVSGEMASMIFFDVDGMTQINQHYGSDVGDKVIPIIEHIWGSCIRETSLIRIGSDEFLCCLRGWAHDRALKAAEVCRRRIVSYEWRSIAPDLRVTASFGVAGLSLKDRSLDHWVIRAIHGSRYAKALGGNKVQEAPLALDQRLSGSIEAYLS